MLLYHFKHQTYLEFTSNTRFKRLEKNSLRCLVNSKKTILHFLSSLTVVLPHHAFHPYHDMQIICFSTFLHLHAITDTTLCFRILVWAVLPSSESCVTCWYCHLSLHWPNYFSGIVRLLKYDPEVII